LLAERGLHADHVTVWRWVQRYAPEMERRLRSRLRPTNDSWRVDETYIRVKGKWVYLYRAVDSSGANVDFLLSAKRDAAAAERFLAKALGGENHPAPRVINTDQHAGYAPAIVQGLTGIVIPSRKTQARHSGQLRSIRGKSGGARSEAKPYRRFQQTAGQ
jgi:IS6 family transposase